MRICHVTNYYFPNRFGHAHYTRALIAGCRAARPEQHLVAGEGPTPDAEDEAVRSIPCWRRADDYVEGVVSGVRRLGADLAVVQHSDDLFGLDNRLPRLLAGLRAASVTTVVNLHSVYPPERRSGYLPGRTAGDFDRAVAAAASCVNVHSARMRRDLVARGVDPAKVTVIPHGSLVQEPPDRAASREALGIPADAKVIAFFGFVWLGKGLDFLLDVFAHVLARVPEAYLYIGGYTRQRSIWTRIYMDYLAARQRWLGIAPRTGRYGDYVPDEMVPAVYAAADVVALPYRQDYSSVSGVLHQAAGFGRVCACSRIAKFDEVGEGIDPALLVGEHDERGWVRLLARLLTDRPLAAAAEEQTRRFAQATSWEAVGRQHLALYDRLLAGGPAAPATEG